MSATNDLLDLEATQEAAWEALKAAAPVEHEAWCLAIKTKAASATILKAYNAFRDAAPSEHAAYREAVNNVVIAQLALTDEEFTQLGLDFGMYEDDES